MLRLCGFLFLGANHLVGHASSLATVPLQRGDLVLIFLSHVLLVALVLCARPLAAGASADGFVHQEAIRGPGPAEEQAGRRGKASTSQALRTAASGEVLSSSSDS